MKKIIFFIIIILFTLSSYSQNYKCIVENSIYYFDSDWHFNVIRIDSVLNDGNNLVYYNYPTMTESDIPDCYTDRGPSWLGRTIIEKPNSDFLFTNFNTEEILIKTQASVNETWVSYEFGNGDYIQANVNWLQEISILDFSDNAKKITFQAYNSDGETMEHIINGKYILLSENHGLVRSINFKFFPDLSDNYFGEYCMEFDLCGIEGNLNGVQNLKKENIFDLNIGDEYHTNKMSGYWPDEGQQELLVHQVLDKEVYQNGDSLVYTISRCGRKKHVYYDTSWHVYYNDTIELIYNINNFTFIDSLHKDFFYTEDGDERWYYYNSQSHFQNSNRQVKYHLNGFLSTPPHDCIETVFYANKDQEWESYYFIEGLAGPYWDHVEYGWESFRRLLYYKTATEEWGEPLNCDSLMVNIEAQKLQNQKVFFTPNPISEKSTLKFSNPNFDNCTLTLYNIYGKQVKQHTTSGNEIVIDKENLVEGIYLYSLIIGNRLVHSGKLMVR